LATAVCYRTGLARWRLEFGPRIPTLEADGTPRALGAIMLDVNRALEVAVRRDPANWFWVHRRWKPASNRQRNARELAVPGEAAE
jgi:KDO2-lipid IV(A) lauroyltransferase